VSELPIALDAMGGDHGPAPNVEGAAAAIRNEGLRVVLVGDEAAIRAQVEAQRAADLLSSGSLTIRHAPDVVTMDDKPAQAARKKKDSSLRIACDLVEKGEASGALSAGNSGAMMATALLVFGRIDGVLRPAIGTMLPSATATGLVHLVDAGANTDCEPAHLAQWAALGATYVKHVSGVARPRVGVVSNGEEESKGTELTRGALALVKHLPRVLPVEVVGYVEGRDLNKGSVDVVVTDGFTGNVMLKTAEGVFRFVTAQIKQGYERGGLVDKLGGALSTGMFDRMRKRLDPREFGAAPLLGLARPAFIAHGSSDGYAIRRGLGAVAAFTKNDVGAQLRQAVLAMQPILDDAKARASATSTT
jgi:glycerol-3-phosphate acyltransferase PlsX